MINLCHNIITKDICIERILERFYNLENGNISGEEKENLNCFKNKRDKEINEYNYKEKDDKLEDNYLDKNKENK